MDPALRVLKNSTALSASVLVERAFGFLLPWYIARTQGNEIWGSYNTALPFVIIAAPFAFWGLDQLVPREVARNRQQAGAYLGSGLMISGSIAIVVTLLTMMVTRFLNYPRSLELLIYVALATNVIPRAEATVCESVITGLERMELIVAVRLPLTVLRTVGAVFLLIQGYGLKALFIILGAYHLSLSLFYILLLFRFVPGLRFRLDRRLMGSLIVQAVPFVLIILTGETMRQMDRIFLSKLWDVDAVGFYATGTMLIQVLYLVAPAIMTAVFPSLARVYVTSEQRFAGVTAQIFKLLLVAVFPLALAVIGLAGWIIPLVFGPEYDRSIIVLRITALGIAPSFVARLLYRVILASDNERLAVQAAVFKGSTSLILNILLIPGYGIVGASVAAAVAEVFGLAQNLFYVSNRIVPFDFRNALIRPGISILGSGLIYLGLSQWNHVGAWLGATAVFLVGIFITRAVHWHELARLVGYRIT